MRLRQPNGNAVDVIWGVLSSRATKIRVETADHRAIVAPIRGMHGGFLLLTVANQRLTDLQATVVEQSTTRRSVRHGTLGGSTSEN